MNTLRFRVVACVVSAMFVFAFPTFAFGNSDSTGEGRVVFTTKPPALTNKTTADFVFEATGPTTCQLDDQEPWECAGPITVPDLTHGSHTFTVNSSDGASATHEWTVDTVEPVVIFRSSIKKDGNKVPYTNETSASFTYSTTDPTAELQCRMPASVGYTYFNLSDGRRARIPVPGGPYVSCPPSPHTLSGLAEGDHMVNVRAIDPAGNITTQGLHWRVDYEFVPPDTTPPTINLDAPNRIDADTYELSFRVSEKSTLRCWHNTGPVMSGKSTPLESCTSPITVTGVPEGRNEISIEATDPSGNRASAGRGWIVDRTPPEVLINSAPPSTTGSTAIVRFSSSESSSQQTFECSLDDGPWAPCSTPVELRGLSDGPHSFAIRATDGYGNTGEPTTTDWKVDGKGPEARILSGPSALTSSSEATFLIEAPGEGGAIECSLDELPWESCKSETVLTRLSEGAHAFRVRATDEFGNAGPITTYEWAVDLTGPVVTFTSRPGDSSQSSLARPSWASEPGASFRCRLDEGEWSDCVSPAFLSALGDGRHTFEVQGTDRVGNAGPVASLAWTVAVPPPPADPGPLPTVSIDSGPPSWTASSSATFEISQTPGTVLSCRSTLLGFMFSRAWKPCKAPVILNGFQSGAHSFEVRAIDETGRVSASQAWTWAVDNIAPPVRITSAPLPTTVTTLASFSFDSNDRQAAFRCSLDSGPWTACTSPTEYRGLEPGEHTFEVVAIDFVGNRSNPIRHTWQVVKPVPDYTIFGESDPVVVPVTEVPVTEPQPETVKPEPEPDPAPTQPNPDPAPEDGPGQGGDPVPTVLQPTALQAPRILSAPARTSSRRPSFRLSAPEPGTGNLCAIGKAQPVACGTIWRPSARLAPGRHLFTVVARAGDGRVTAPATHRFRVIASR